jgi:threonine dehydratase
MPEQTVLPLTQAIRPTTLIESVRLNHKTALDIVLASETFQVTGSFKYRAAYNVAANVPQKRIITQSSGNFGQAIAYACKVLGKQCTVVMPDNSASVKIEAVKEFGGIVDLVETEKKSRAQRVKELSEADPEARVVSAFDDPLVIAGNASLGVELAALIPHVDAVLVPIGGGGLSAGIIQGLQSRSSTTEVYGVEPAIANDASRSFREGKIVAFAGEPQTIADGVRTLSLGAHNWEILKSGLKDVIEVEERTIEESMRLLFTLANVKCEPTGAVSLAGAMTKPEWFKGKRICCVVSGGNVDTQVFMRIIGNS